MVGEGHSQRNSKNFLIQNMAKLKEAGFTTLFMEHLYYDDQQELDEYSPQADNLKSDDDLLGKRLENLDNGWRIPSENGNKQCPMKLGSNNK